MQRTLLALAVTAAFALSAPIARAAGPISVASTVDGVYTFSFTNLSFTGFEFQALTGYGAGTLTSVGVDAVLTDSALETYANDLTIYVSPALDFGGQLQVGGYSDLEAVEAHSWANGESDVIGTRVNDTVLLATPLRFTGTASDPFIYLGNGYGEPDTYGTWTGSITLNFVPAVPEPQTWLLMIAGGAGIAAWAGRRQRQG